MTAKRAGELAADGFWSTLRRIRDHWIVLAFLASGLFWLRDAYEQFIDLPGQVDEVRGSLGELRADIARLRQAAPDKGTDRSAALVFPGTGHSIEDGKLGGFVTVRLAPAKRLRSACRARALAVFMIDATGRWFTVPTDLAHLPHFAGAQDLAFSVRIHPRMALGRAQMLVQVTQDCGTHLQVDSTPRLHFRVLPAVEGTSAD